jgi:hypothetical protein
MVVKLIAMRRAQSATVEASSGCCHTAHNAADVFQQKRVFHCRVKAIQ